MAVDRSAAERAIAAFLTALGHDPERSIDLKGTPARVVEAFERDLLSGYSVDVPALLAAESTPLAPDAPRGVVLVRDVSVATVCPHHLLPGLGRAAIAYAPGDRIVGIGTLARIAEAYARRLTLQETIGEEVVRALVEHAGARGATCTLQLRHTCLAARGNRQSDATVVTFARAGEPFEVPPSSRGGP